LILCVIGGAVVSALDAPPDWPAHVPAPGATVSAIETALGRPDAVAALSSDITELTYDFGLRLRVHETHGLAFMELSAPWAPAIFGIQIDEPLPQSELDRFTRPPRFTRGVFVGLPAHPHWFVDVDDRVDAVRRLLFIDPELYGPPTDIPGVR
jgi:hypothetical protein